MKTKEGSAPRRPTEMPIIPRSAGTATSGVFVNEQDWVNGGRGGSGGAGCWQPAIDNDRTVHKVSPAERLKIGI